MPLTTGTRLGSYEIHSALGAGGMGEVYRARDLKLGRDVALKILPDIFAADPERLARFEREAQVLASLNHVNIAAIHGLQEDPAEDGHHLRALVLEFVDGPTLADRLASGALPPADALDIARQIADALETAHDRGIVHRDLKPANIKVRPDGAVKVLDFGLAKLATLDDGGRSSLATNSPTLTMQATAAGMILGTAAYMSPEQAKGKPVDRRADIWAFGVVLAEMLTGSRMYDGETAPETLARVIEREPDLNALPAATPDSIRALLARCLTKDPRSRLQAIGEARIVIERAIAESEGAPTMGGPAPASAAGAAKAGHDVRTTRKRALPWIATVASSLVLAAVWLLQYPRQAPVISAPIRMTVAIGADASLRTDFGTAAALSPNGQTLAFAAQSAGKSLLYVRRLDQLQARPLAGTDDAHGPFFSPDGQWIAFFAGGKLKKVSVVGGAVVTLCDAPAGRGGSWAQDHAIVLQPDIGATSSSGFVRVAAVGGMPEPLTKPEEIGRGRYPQVLPGGNALLYTRYGPGSGASVMLQSLATDGRRVLLSGAYGQYVSSGHILYMQASTLFAVPFDVKRLEITGPAVPMIEGVSAADNMAAAQFAVSDTGTLVYVPGAEVNSDPPIVWLTRDGKTTSLRAQPANWSSLHFSPDGRTLAMNILLGNNEDIFTYDWERGALTRLTSDAAPDRAPVWTPDGRRIVFSSTRDAPNNGGFNLYWQRADLTGEVQRLTENSETQMPGSWHPSGKFLAFSQASRANNLDLWMLPIEGDETNGWKPGQPTLFWSTPLNDTAPEFSPDGRWIAYQSIVAGRGEVHVRAFPGPGGPWQVSFDDGRQPKWSRTQSELFYLSNGRIMVVPYRVEGNSFRADPARVWSDTRVQIRPRWEGSLDLHPDGTRFAVAPPPDQKEQTKQNTVVVVFNFFDELRHLAPVAAAAR